MRKKTCLMLNLRAFLQPWHSKRLLLLFVITKNKSNTKIKLFWFNMHKNRPGRLWKKNRKNMSAICFYVTKSDFCAKANEIKQKASYLFTFLSHFLTYFMCFAVCSNFTRLNSFSSHFISLYFLIKIKMFLFACYSSCFCCESHAGNAGKKEQEKFCFSDEKKSSGDESSVN